MPSKSPSLPGPLVSQLAALGEQIRDARRQQKISATSTAEAAGMSRVTLHRIERGEPSVTMGAYLGAIAAVGLRIELSDPRATPPGRGRNAELPERVRLDDFPELKRLAWQRHDAGEISPAEALSLYERNWRHVDHVGMGAAERRLVQDLVDHLSGGRRLV